MHGTQSYTMQVNQGHAQHVGLCAAAVPLRVQACESHAIRRVVQVRDSQAFTRWSRDVAHRYSAGGLVLDHVSVDSWRIYAPIGLTE